MIWQDIVIVVVMIAFSYALIPQVYQGFKKKKGPINVQTSTITSIGMLILTIIYITLGLTFSAIICEITGILWSILLFQKAMYK